MLNQELYNKVKNTKAISRWRCGVLEQALELVEMAETVLTLDNVQEVLLCGAKDWSEYSYSGNTLIFDGSICKRYATPGERRKTNGGQLDPNPRETWLDLQARALHQAYKLIEEALTPPVIVESNCEYFSGSTSCHDRYDCCACGGNDCGCMYCFACNACETCRDE